jgi:integrase/recombinase XerC
MIEEKNIFTELKELQQRFLDDLKQKKKKSKYTIASYRLDLDAFLDFIQRSKTDIASQSLESQLSRYVLFLKQHATISKVSVARKISCLSTFLRFLTSEGILVTLSLKRPYFIPKKPQFLAYHEIQQLFDQSEKKKERAQCYTRERAIWELLLSTGIRCSEIVNLTLEDTGLDDRIIQVKDTKLTQRTVSFNDRTAIWLSQYVQYERPRYVPKEDFLFLNSAGFQLTHRAIQRSLKLLERLLETKTTLTPHVIRHSYAMFLLQDGHSYATIKYILGLKATETVEKYKLS